MIIKINKNHILEYLLVIFIILASETIWEKIPDKALRDVFSIFAYGGVSIILSILILTGNKLFNIKNSRKIIWHILYFMVLLLVNLIIYKINVALLFCVPTMLMAIYFVLNTNEIINILDKFYVVTYYIAFCSLMVFIPYILLEIIQPPTSFPFLRNNWTQYAPSFYIFSYPQGIRNCAFFYEAPKYNVILTLALAYSFYIKEQFLNIKNYIIILCILSAQSVTGILLTIIMLLTKVAFNKNNFAMYRNNYLLLIFPIVLFFSVILFYVIFDEKISSASGIERILDYSIGFNAWKEGIFFGSGIGNNETIDNAAYFLGRETLGFSNGLFRILAQGGIYLFLLFLVPFIQFVKEGFYNKKPYILFFATIFFLMIYTTSFTNTMVYSLFILFFSNFRYIRNKELGLIF